MRKAIGTTGSAALYHLILMLSLVTVARSSLEKFFLYYIASPFDIQQRYTVVVLVEHYKVKP